MKRIATLGVVLTLAAVTLAQDKPATPPAGQQAPAQAGQGTAAAKRPPQAKTKPEYDAYNATIGNTDPAAMEKAVDDFATKFPDSELRVPLYKATMQAYQKQGNTEKIMAMGRKALAIDGDDPEALVTVASEIAEKTHDTDLDKDQRYDEAVEMAQKALKTVDTDIAFPPNMTPAQVDAYKQQLRSFAYSIVGTIEFKRDQFPQAEADLRKSIDAFPSNPDPVVVLRLAISMDRQERYADALKQADRAVELTQDGTPVGQLARQERDRLSQLAKPGSAPADKKN
jgi:tetratricopeptide (TPR) repeat protein